MNRRQLLLGATAAPLALLPTSKSENKLRFEKVPLKKDKYTTVNLFLRTDKKLIYEHLCGEFFLAEKHHNIALLSNSEHLDFQNCKEDLITRVSLMVFPQCFIETIEKEKTTYITIQGVVKGIPQEFSAFIKENEYKIKGSGYIMGTLGQQGIIQHSKRLIEKVERIIEEFDRREGNLTLEEALNL